MMTDDVKASLSKFFKDYPEAAKAINRQDFDTVFKLLSYTNIPAADLIILLQDADVSISGNDIADYYDGIERSIYKNIARDINDLAKQLDWDPPTFSLKERTVTLEKDYFEGEYSDADIHTLQTKLEEILNRHSNGLDKYDFEFRIIDDDWEWENGDDRGYTCVVYIDLFNKWNLNFKGQK